MRYEVESILIAANMLDDPNERERIKRDLFEHLMKNHPEILEQLANCL